MSAGSPTAAHPPRQPRPALQPPPPPPPPPRLARQTPPRHHPRDHLPTRPRPHQRPTRTPTTPPTQGMTLRGMPHAYTAWVAEAGGQLVGHVALHSRAAALTFDDEALEAADQIEVVLRRSGRPGGPVVRHNPDTVLRHTCPRHRLAYAVTSGDMHDVKVRKRRMEDGGPIEAFESRHLLELRHGPSKVVPHQPGSARTPECGVRDGRQQRRGARHSRPARSQPADLIGGVGPREMSAAWLAGPSTTESSAQRPPGSVGMLAVAPPTVAATSIPAMRNGRSASDPRPSARRIWEWCTQRSTYRERSPASTGSSTHDSRRTRRARRERRDRRRGSRRPSTRP